MWELKTAADLNRRSTYVPHGEHHASARDVTGDVLPNGSAVDFPSRGRWAYPPRDEDELTTLAVDTPLYILKCTCTGMSFIANRWTFTGQCSCVHHPLPKESNDA